MATPCSTRNPLFLGRWFQDEVIIVAVRRYLTNPLSYRQVPGNPDLVDTLRVEPPPFLHTSFHVDGRSD